MTEWKIAEAVSVKARIPVERAMKVVITIFQLLAEALSKGDGVLIRDFGTFSVKGYRRREIRHPGTGVRMEVRPKRKAVFKTAKKLRVRLQKRP